MSPNSVCKAAQAKFGDFAPMRLRPHSTQKKKDKDKLRFTGMCLRNCYGSAVGNILVFVLQNRLPGLNRSIKVSHLFCPICIITINLIILSEKRPSFIL